VEKKSDSNSGKLAGIRCGDPGLIRTADLRFRKPMLYPSELRGHLIDFTRIVEEMA
jgi:hypothetical protein